MRYWWVTANLHNPRFQWHWREFFEKPFDAIWGRGKITERAALCHIAEMDKWDIIVAYQAKECLVHGLACLRRGGFRNRPSRASREDSFEVAARPFVPLIRPVPLSRIQSLPAADDIEFIHKHMGSVFDIGEQGFNGIVRRMIRMNPDQEEEIRSFISWVKAKASGSVEAVAVG
jgi:hypothetical protein